MSRETPLSAHLLTALPKLVSASLGATGNTLGSHEFSVGIFKLSFPFDHNLQRVIQEHVLAHLNNHLLTTDLGHMPVPVSALGSTPAPRGATVLGRANNNRRKVDVTGKRCLELGRASDNAVGLVLQMRRIWQQLAFVLCDEPTGPLSHRSHCKTSSPPACAGLLQVSALATGTITPGQW